GMFWVLGGGGGGFEGALGGSLAGGIRLPVTPHGGFVLRAGMEGYLLGNDYLYASMLELPQGQFGYQFMNGRRLFEVGGKLGAVLTGRYRDPQADLTRKLNSAVEWGSYASLHFTPVRLDAAFTRIEARRNEPNTPLDIVSGSVCGLARWVAVCIDGRFERGDLALADGTGKSFQSTYAGLTIGAGYRRDEHRGEAKTAKKGAVASILGAFF